MLLLFFSLVARTRLRYDDEWLRVYRLYSVAQTREVTAELSADIEEREIGGRATSSGVFGKRRASDYYERLAVY